MHRPAARPTMARALGVCAVGVMSLVCLCGVTVQAYVPALPTNDTATSGVNESDTSLLELQWYPMGEYSETVSYQLQGANSNGINKGALVHFSEQNLSNDTTTTPWIALISCDTNVTGYTNDTDVFTFAQERGAVAALLYSQWSEACTINAEFADPASFDQIMDIFSTKSLSSAQFIQDDFSVVNSSLYSNFNAARLNDSAAAIQNTIDTGVVPSATYLFATLMAANATIPIPPSSSNATNVIPDTSPANTDLAMIVLYVITGAVSLLFCIVILSGAIRAIRHPERYGPRAADPSLGPAGQGQSRARGLTRAIVDTFPVIKFTRPPVPAESDEPADDLRSDSLDHKMPVDLETGPGYREAPIELKERSSVGDTETTTDQNQKGRRSASVEEREERRASTSSAAADGHKTPRGQSHSSERLPAASGSAESGAGESDASPAPLRRRPTHTTRPQSEIMPAAIGRDTCPICIFDFEEGDDLRVLPCEGKHVFHQTCVDPWLLELSSSCPICRQDFQALESMISGDMPDEEGYQSNAYPRQSSHHQHAPRFTRYLRFARSRRGHRFRGHQDNIMEDPTDPMMPMAHHGSAQ